MKLTNKILEAINQGIKFALDDFEDNDIQGQTNSKVKYKGGTKEYLELMENVVDLGLPSGTLWCKYNLGVNPNKLKSAKKWYGDFYAWGETEPNKLKYTWETYTLGNEQFDLFKYMRDNFYSKSGKADKLLELLPEDDAAYLNMHIGNYKFHIPTKELFEELISNTTHEYIKKYNGINKLNGMVFIGKNGNTLFLPGSGMIEEKYYNNQCGYYWTSTLDEIACNMAFRYWFNQNSIFYSLRRECEDPRYYGFNIRPVLNLNE